MCAYLGGNLVDIARGVERSTGTFVGMAAETDGTALAVFLVAVKEIADVSGDCPAKNFRRIVVNVAHDIGRIRF